MMEEKDCKIQRLEKIGVKHCLLAMLGLLTSRTHDSCSYLDKEDRPVVSAIPCEGRTSLKKADYFPLAE